MGSAVQQITDGQCGTCPHVGSDVRSWPLDRSLPICRACRIRLAIAMVDGTAPSALEQYKRGETTWQPA